MSLPTNKKADRGTLWTHSEIGMLIRNWAAQEVQQMLSTCKNHRDVFVKVATNIPGRDYLSCQKKIQQLKREYLKHKDKLSRRGQTSDISLPNVIAAHYDLFR